MPDVKRRYAEALARTALEEGRPDEFREELGEVVEVLETNREIMDFIANPMIKTEVRKETLAEILEGYAGQKIINLLFLLIDNRRIKELKGIQDEFNSIINRKMNIIDMVIYSAYPLEESRIEDIKEKYRKLYGASAARAAVEINPDIVGGLKVRIGDTLIDGSIKGRIESLKKYVQG